MLAVFATSLTFLGLSVVPEDTLREAIGPPPEAGPAVATWADGATVRIESKLNELGYTAARVWHRAHGEHVSFEVDEGHMFRVSFAGASVIQKGVLGGSWMLSPSIDVDRGPLHAPTLDALLEEIEASPSVLATSWHVDDTSVTRVTALGETVNERILYIDLVNRESTGPGIDFDLPAIWGIFVMVYGDTGDRFGPEPWMHAEVTYAPPLINQFLDGRPGPARWNFGAIELQYVGPDVSGKPVSPFVRARHMLANYPRHDIGLDHVIVSDFFAAAGVELHREQVFQLGLMTHRADITRYTASPGSGTARPPGTWRIGAYAAADYRWEDRKVRRDLHDWLHLEAWGAMSTLGEPSMMMQGDFQAVKDVGRTNHLLLRGRGIYSAGDMRFFDDLQLAGNFQRVLFNRRYWVREAASIEMAFRKGLTRDWGVGVWHDASLFHDRSTEAGGAFTLVDGFGPSVHWVLFHQFAIDVQYGGGFSPVGFSHNARLNFKAIY